MKADENDAEAMRDRSFRTQVWGQLVQLWWLPVLVIVVVVLMIKGIF